MNGPHFQRSMTGLLKQAVLLGRLDCFTNKHYAKLFPIGGRMGPTSGLQRFGWILQSVQNRPRAAWASPSYPSTYKTMGL
jgi:hypothetical protein